MRFLRFFCFVVIHKDPCGAYYETVWIASKKKAMDGTRRSRLTAGRSEDGIPLVPVLNSASYSSHSQLGSERESDPPNYNTTYIRVRIWKILTYASDWTFTDAEDEKELPKAHEIKPGLCMKQRILTCLLTALVKQFRLSFQLRKFKIKFEELLADYKNKQKIT